MASGLSGAGQRRLHIALALSLAVHVLTAVAISYWQVPMLRNPVRRGEPMMVELQGPDALAPAGNPALHEPPGPPQPRTPPTRPPRAAQPRPAVRPPAPAPRVTAPPAAPPAPRATRQPAAPPASKATTPPLPAPELPVPKPPRVASAPPPPVADARQPEPLAASEPAPRPAERAPEPARPAAGNETAGRSSPSTPGGAEGPRVASVPPGDAGSGGAGRGAAPAAPDIRSLLRARPGGGGGGRGGGWGGIEGEPIPLDSADPKFNEYLDRVRRLIKANWGYPCVKNASTRECEYKSATLVVAFGILKNGQLQVVEVRRSSGLPIYDDYAVNAIKLASPFPEVPAAMMTRGSAGLPIMATFNYVSETSLVNLLR